MILEHLYQGEPGAWKITFRADAAEEAANPGQPEKDLMAAAVNRAILSPAGFSPCCSRPNPPSWTACSDNRTPGLCRPGGPVYLQCGAFTSASPCW